jgi:glutathione S-transferase
MILIGQYDSPFVRRAGIALRLYGLPFEHRPWSVFADAEKIQRYNPLIRVPTLVLDTGIALTDSHIILDHIDSLAAPERRLFPAREPERHRALRIAALATGAAEKAVSLFYETRLHTSPSTLWVTRCTDQISGTLAALDIECRRKPGPWWGGESIGHADIAVAVVMRFVSEAHPDLFDMTRHHALSAHAAMLEALPVFQEIRQPFQPPA